MDKMTVLIVDDSSLNRKILNNALSEDYNILEASNGIEALNVINKNKQLSLVILDIMMPELNGIEVLKIIKSKPDSALIPIILLTAADSNEEYAFELGAVDFIAKPFNVNVVKSRVKTQLELRYLKNNNAELNFVNSIYKEITDLALSSLLFGNRESFSNIIKQDREAVSKFLEKLKENNLYEENKTIITDNDFVNSICFRDIGKLFIRDNLILKNSSFTAEEYEAVKKHTILSDRIFDKIPKNMSTPILSLVMDICYYHHENYDGSGYPMGLKGSAIPFPARIAAIFDCYEAIISDKPYRKAHSHKYAVDFIRANRGIKFDPALADIFISMDKELERIYFL